MEKLIKVTVKLLYYINFVNNYDELKNETIHTRMQITNSLW